jgi:arsenate reductase (thioredoxin)
MSNRTKVLFLCTGNSARSQMAEALLRHIAGDRYEAFSAGTEPKEVHTLTLSALEEIGVTTAGLRSKSLREFLGHQHFSHVVIVCSQAAESCPTVWPGVSGNVPQVKRLFFDDPAAATGTEEAQLAAFRAVRDQIQECIAQFAAEQAHNAELGQNSKSH